MRANVATLALEKLIFIIWIKCKCFHNAPAFQLKMWKSIAYVLLGINNGRKTSYEMNFCVEEFSILVFP